MYSPFSGVTTNQSESFNAVLKRLHSWREVPLDAIVLSLYYLQSFYLNEIQRGFAGLGSYTLVPDLVKAQRPVDEILVIPTFQPEEIVERIQQKCTSEILSSNKESSKVAPSAKEDNNHLFSTQHSRAR